ncbi:3-dehydroquinate synthase [Moheibacter stercoris]|uniref:3-dehydroquinate synthase n=1 Tax=Moheibacter stercoris TaxID=1628251 RepID=A0ABV2LUC6_9FLAO
MKQSPIIFGNIYEELNKFLSEKSYDIIFLFVDSNTHEHCLPTLLGEMETQSAMEIIEIPPGEENKDLEIVAQIWQSLAELGASRKSLFINLGGGVITDMGGFIASTFKRGIDFINIPTTLLSMVDASVGGKTGIDFGGLKNQIGTFSMPQMTLIEATFLETLEEREFRSGIAEMLKHGLIYQPEHWNSLQNITGETIQNLIEDSVTIKSEIVAQDPKESGLRKILNFGHTIGHAFESYYLQTDNSLLHGEAIAIGMLVESILTFENEMISQTELDEIFEGILKIFPSQPIDENIIPSLVELMKHDKKNQGGKISFSLLNGIGSAKYDVLLNENQISEGILIYNKKLNSYE